MNWVRTRAGPPSGLTNSSLATRHLGTKFARQRAEQTNVQANLPEAPAACRGSIAGAWRPAVVRKASSSISAGLVTSFQKGTSFLGKNPVRSSDSGLEMRRKADSLLGGYWTQSKFLPFARCCQLDLTISTAVERW